MLFDSQKESSLSSVDPLDLSVSLSLGLLVFNFYHPTNRDLYLVGGGGAYFWLKSTFSKLFWTCLGSVWALFLTSKGLLLDVF